MWFMPGRLFYGRALDRICCIFLRERAVTNSLGLDDDLDGVEALQTIERVFDVKVSNEEATQMQTVGNLFDLLVEKIPSNTLDKKCASAMAFYRLRRAIHELGYGNAQLPTSGVSFLDRGNVRRKLKNIEHATALNLPSVRPTAPGWIGGVLIFLAIPFAAYYVFPHAVSVIFGALAGFFAGIYFVAFIDPGRLPMDCHTLGDLARKTALLSFGKLAKAGARHTHQDIWDNLIEALSCYELAKSEITRETFFLKSQLKKADAT
jgi:acyl carrier protein